jgi:hypothetical protein
MSYSVVGKSKSKSSLKGVCVFEETVHQINIETIFFLKFKTSLKQNYINYLLKYFAYMLSRAVHILNDIREFSN